VTGRCANSLGRSAVPIPAGRPPCPRPAAGPRLGSQPYGHPAALARGRPAGPAQRRHRQRLGTSTTPADRLAPSTRSRVGAGYQFDQTEDGRRLKPLNVVDEHPREALRIAVNRRIDADATVAVQDRLVLERGRPPRFIRMDNGPELTANALRDWSRFTGPEPATSSRDRPGRTRTSRASAAAWAMSCWPSRPSPPHGSSGVGRGLADPGQHRPAPSALGYLTPTDDAKAWTTNHPHAHNE
jgi:putative transposase